MSEPSTGTVHHVPFSVAGITGITLVDFTRIFFTVDGLPVNIDTQNSLILVELGFGYYQFEYIPTVVGYHLLVMHNSARNFDVVDGVDITSALSYVNLTQDTGGTDNLKADTVDDPASYLLMAFLSSDWQVGRTDPTYAVASTQLDDSGNWLATPLVIQHGIYHIVIQSNITAIVISAFLEV